jgi:hypothetical protein
MNELFRFTCMPLEFESSGDFSLLAGGLHLEEVICWSSMADGKVTSSPF